MILPDKVGHKGSLSKEPEKIIKINVETVNTVKNILIIWIKPTYLELTPHFSAPNTISSNPPGEAIKMIQLYLIFLLYWGINKSLDMPMVHIKIIK